MTLRESAGRPRVDAGNLPVDSRRGLGPVGNAVSRPERHGGDGRGRPGPSFSVLLVALVAGLAVSIVASVSIGVVTIPFSVSARILAHHLIPGVGAAGTAIQDQIIWKFRLPRSLLAVPVGAGLSLVGAVLQAVVRNPLADPYLLGVSSGASLGAVLVLAGGAGAVGGLSLSGAAFVGGLLTTALLYALAQRGGRITPSRLILAGVALAYLFQAGFSYVLITVRAQGAHEILFWLLGSLGAARWNVLLVPTVVLVVGIAALLVSARPLNALLAGENTATSLGVNVNRFRIQLLVITSLLTGVMVSVSGSIAFVGLIIPHVARLIVGSNHRRMLPVATLMGAIFLELVDLAARVAHPPLELPLTIVTAAIGVPFFLWLLRRRDTSEQMAA